MEVRQLNTDLEIESKSDISRIVEEFGEDVLVLHPGKEAMNTRFFEIAGGSKDADATRLEVTVMLKFKQLRCSFCRKKDSQVEKLVAGPRAYTGARVYICDSCVAIAAQIMNKPPDNDNGIGVQLSMWRKVSYRLRRFIRVGLTRRRDFVNVA